MSTPGNVRQLRPGQPQHAAQARQSSKPVTSWSADQLMNTSFPEPAWAVPGLIPEGVALLVGAPKVGKSWASLGMALAIASGGTVFGSIQVDPGPVLYLALEDTPRRLKHRMGKILAGTPAPPSLTIATECPALPNGGDTLIGGWIERNSGARMVVIDVFAKVRGHTPPGTNPYEADYAAVTRAKQLADRYGTAVVLVHHVRKAGAEDFLNEVSGTNGIAGAADTILNLRRGRGQADALLHVTGRDVDETEKALSFHAPTGTWQLMDGPASDHQLHDTRATILRCVRDRPGMGPGEIATTIPGANAATIRQTCARMAGDGQLRKDPGGRYHPTELPGQEELPE